MSLLNANNLPVSAIELMAETIRVQLETAFGFSGKLNQTVKLGVDAILKDALEQKLPEQDMPAIRITWGNSNIRWSTNAGGALMASLPLHLFFIYSVGRTNASVLPVEFAALRERHIFWNLEHLKDRGVGPNNTIGLTRDQFKDSNGKAFWLWGEDDADVTVNHDTPFDVFGQTIEMPPGFSCSRVDLPVRVMCHIPFSGAIVAQGSTNRITLSTIMLQTDGVLNGSQASLNLQSGTGITLTDNGTGTITIDSAAIPVTFQTNGVDNGSQGTLNLVAGTNVTLTDDGSGNVTIDSTGGGGSSSGPTFAITSADYNYSTAAIADIPELSFSVGANETWVVEVDILGSGQGAQFGFGGPANLVFMSIGSDARTGSTGYQHNRLTAFGQLDAVFNWTATPGVWRARGVLITGATAGTVTVQLDSAAGLNVTIFQGALLKAYKQ